MLDREIFYTLREVQILTGQYRKTYNHITPHSSPGLQAPGAPALTDVEPVPELAGLT